MKDAYSRWTHLARNGVVIRDWMDNETVDFSRGNAQGVNARLSAPDARLSLQR